jgi:hypothetical protein
VILETRGARQALEWAPANPKLRAILMVLMTGDRVQQATRQAIAPDLNPCLASVARRLSPSERHYWWRRAALAAAAYATMPKRSSTQDAPVKPSTSTSESGTGSPLIMRYCELKTRVPTNDSFKPLSPYRQELRRETLARKRTHWTSTDDLN